MNSVIQKLESQVIDQISAGEVVERPAHLMKELIENSLDASASVVEIQFAEGGQYISVKDNGSGISPKDMTLALSRHATSKIKKAGDLFSLTTYGFRGEALASISSVSHLTLISRTKNSPQAYRLQSHFGKTLKVSAVGGAAGTTVTVDQLFRNTPARLRFLKSEAVETLAIKNVIISQALSHPNVSFRVTYKGRLLFFWPAASSYQERAEAVLSQKLYHSKYSEGPWAVEVLLSPPNKTMKSSKKMLFFVNSRSVEDKILYGAVMSAHQNLLMHKEYPILVLYLTCPPSDLDVNIHPTKTKIRFLSQSRVFQIVQKTVRDLLEKGPWLTNLAPSVGDLFKEAEESSVKQTVLPSQTTDQQESLLSSAPKTLNQKLSVEVPPQKSEVFFKNQKTASKSNEDVQYQSQIIKSPKAFSSLKVLAQAHKTYIVTQSSMSVVFVDQHAAHERILFEKLMAQIKNKKVSSQKKLMALKITLDPAEVQAVLSMKSSFESLGVCLESKKSDEISVLTTPLFIKESALQKIITEIAENYIQCGESLTAEKAVSEAAASLACHSAIRAGRVLSISEMEHLLEQLDQLSFASCCPHGRPVFVEYPFSRLERDFGRIC